MIAKKALTLTDEYEKLPGIKELLKQIRLPNKIETVKEEDFVIRSFLRHGSANQIRNTLNERYKDIHFSYNDISEFLMEYKDAINYRNSLTKKAAQNRIMKTREGLTNELLELAQMSKKLATKYDGMGDNSSAISAVKAAADIFYRNAKLEGLLDETPNVSINVEMDKMVLSASKQDSSFAMSLKKYVEDEEDKTIDVEAVKKDA